METLTIGCLCFYDSMVGLIPCKLIHAEKDCLGYTRVTLRVTQARGAYCKGDTIQTGTNWTIPRKSVKTRNGVKKIAPYNIDLG